MQSLRYLDDGVNHHLHVHLDEGAVLAVQAACITLHDREHLHQGALVVLSQTRPHTLTYYNAVHSSRHLGCEIKGISSDENLKEKNGVGDFLCTP